MASLVGVARAFPSSFGTAYSARAHGPALPLVADIEGDRLMRVAAKAPDFEIEVSRVRRVAQGW